MLWQPKQKPPEKLAQRYLFDCCCCVNACGVLIHHPFVCAIAIYQVIAAEGEQKASRALREASEVIGDSPAALQLRYLQVEQMITGQNFHIILPALIRNFVETIHYFFRFDFHHTHTFLDFEHNISREELDNRIPITDRLDYILLEVARRCLNFKKKKN